MRSALASSGSSKGRMSASMERVASTGSPVATDARIAWLPMTMTSLVLRSRPAATDEVFELISARNGAQAAWTPA